MMRYVILLALLLCLPVRGEAWQVVGGGEPALFYSDGFTGTDDTLLSDGTNVFEGVGGTYDVPGGTVYLKIASNSLMSADSTATYRIFRNIAAPPSADYSVTVSGKISGTNAADAISACARLDSSFNGYCAVVTGPTGVLLIAKANGVSFTILETGSETTGFSASTEYDIKLSVSGSDLAAQVILNGTVVNTLSASDSTYTAAGSPGGAVRKTVAYINYIEAM